MVNEDLEDSVSGIERKKVLDEYARDKGYKNYADYKHCIAKRHGHSSWGSMRMKAIKEINREQDKYLDAPEINLLIETSNLS